MLPTAHFLLEDPDEVKRLIRENPWATFVSSTSAGLVASHYPVLVEEDAAGLSIVSHFGRPDDVAHELGQHEILVIIPGPHGYVSPGWYTPGDFIPTWNHVTAHLYGVPELLDADENFRILGNLVDHFEDRMPEPQRLQQDERVARAVARGTVGVRLRVTRVDARQKLSQNKSSEVIERIITSLESDEQYAEPRLAREMRRVHRADQ
ncbi:MAG: FMN-binding negative transcriptional regulator [Microbacteriaceae bacterium]